MLVPALERISPEPPRGGILEDVGPDQVGDRVESDVHRLGFTMMAIPRRERLAAGT
jgi:hypothetical protein